MPSAVPVITCITTALIVFVAGSYIYAGRSGNGTRLWSDAKPLFARSVEQGSFASDRWPQGRLEVPYYGPMVELLTLGASRSRPQHNEGLRQAALEPPKVMSAREKRREDTRRQRTKPKRGPDMVDPQDAYARGEPQQRDWRSSSGEGERRRSHGFNREQETRQSRAGDALAAGTKAARGETRREPERRDLEQRWPSERRDGRDGFNLFNGFESR